MNLSDKIKAANDLQRELVKVDAWEAEFYVRELTKSEANWVSRKARETAKIHQYDAELVTKVCVDEEGTRIFADKDAQWLQEKSNAIIRRLLDVCFKVSGLMVDDDDEKKS